MILNFKPERRTGSSRQGNPLLERLEIFWHYARGRKELPLSDNLFLSDFVEEMPYLLLAFRERNCLRVGFAGAAASRLLGGDPTGAKVMAGDEAVPESGSIFGPVLDPALAHCIAASHGRAEPVGCSGTGFRFLCLPFAAADGMAADGALVLAGLVETREAAGAVTPLRR